MHLNKKKERKKERKAQSLINNSLHLAREYARIFVRGHYLFQEANSFQRGEENCELRGTDNVQGQIYKHVLVPNGGCRVYHPSIDQFLYIKIQPETIDLSTRLVGITTEFVGFIPQSLVLA